MASLFQQGLSPLPESSRFSQPGGDALDSPAVIASASGVSMVVESKPLRVSYLNADRSSFVSCLYSPEFLLRLYSFSDDAAPIFKENEKVPDPFNKLDELVLDSQPNDLVSMCIGGTSDLFAIPMVNGHVLVANASSDGRLLALFSDLHTHDNAEAMCACSMETSLVVGGSDGSIVGVDAPTNQKTHITKSGSGVDCIVSVGGGSLLATGHMAGMLNLWDARMSPESGSALTFPRFSISPKTLNDGVTALCVHPAQSNILVAGRESGSVSFIDVRKGASMQPETKNAFEVAKGPIRKVAFHPELVDNFFCGSEDGSLIHWDPSHKANTFTSSSLTRVSPWLSTSLEASSSLSALISSSGFPSSFAVNSFDFHDRSVLVACDNHMIRHTSGLNLV